MKRQKVSSIGDLERLEQLIETSAAETTGKLRGLLQSESALAFLAELKFTQAGYDPLDADRALNVIEQLNQTFTYLASINATRWLLQRHSDHAPFVLNLGMRGGLDVESEDGAVAAETFAATHSASNDKLPKDVAKVTQSGATFKYVFFLSPVGIGDVVYPDVTVIHLQHSSMQPVDDHTTKRKRVMPGTSQRTTAVGYVNRNSQTVLRPTGKPGNDHMQYIYVLECGECGHEYGANGSDIFQRKCPQCQGGMPGLEY